MTSKHDIWAVVPVKGGLSAKQRLSGLLSAEQRTALARAMLEDVLDALVAVHALAGIVLVTADPFTLALARRLGARVLSEGAHDGQTGAVTAAARTLASEGRGAMLTMPGDIPLVTPAEIETVIAWDVEREAFTIVPAHDDLGSNAVLCAPPDRVPLRFGDNSFFPHLDAARRCGLEPAVVRLPGIALDIDHPRDVQAFLRVPSRTRTRALLDDFVLRAADAEISPQADSLIGH